MGVVRVPVALDGLVAAAEAEVVRRDATRDGCDLRGSPCGTGTTTSARRAAAAPAHPHPRRRSASAGRPARRSAARSRSRGARRTARRECGRRRSRRDRATSARCPCSWKAARSSKARAGTTGAGGSPTSSVSRARGGKAARRRSCAPRRPSGLAGYRTVAARRVELDQACVCATRSRCYASRRHATDREEGRVAALGSWATSASTSRGEPKPTSSPGRSGRIDIESRDGHGRNAR